MEFANEEQLFLSVVVLCKMQGFCISLRFVMCSM